MKAKNILTNFPNIFLHAAENMAGPHQPPQRSVNISQCLSQDENGTMGKKYPEMSNVDFQDSEEDDFSLFDETFEVLHREVFELKKKAEMLFDLNIISEKEFIEFMTYLEREEETVKQYEDF